MSLRVLAGIFFAALSAGFFTGSVYATQIVISNLDGPGEGFNDPTPVQPVGLNPGTTLGEQRLFVFQHAAKIWASIINSNVDIIVEAKFDPLTCSATSAVLGSAGAATITRDFPNAPL
ncbi:MAG TPA: peptidase, partial [Gammaproteobacteria bacterium]|nr:peptidase [Gammaproteobacteria bacterium]